MTQYTTKDCRADIVKVNNLTKGLPFNGIWEEMTMHMDCFRHLHSRKPFKNTCFDIEVSPTADESRNWSLADWGKYAKEFIAQLDSMTEGADRNGKRISGLVPTNLAHSQYFAALHRDAKSGIPHLHIIANRIDMDGRTNNSNYIGERCVLAAQIINQRHGWNDTMEIREDNINQINNDILEVLRAMSRFSFEEYFSRLQRKGYSIYKPETKDGKVHGYSVCIGNSRYRSSDLGTGRCYTAAKIERTFEHLHPAPKVVLPVDPQIIRFNKLKAQHPDSVLLLREGDDYLLLKQDAERAAKVLGLTLYTSREHGDENGAPFKYTGFDRKDLDSVLPKLIRNGMRVAVCDGQHQEQSRSGQQGSQSMTSQSASQPSRPSQQPSRPSSSQQTTGTSASNPSRFCDTWNIGGKDYRIDIPQSAYNIIDHQADDFGDKLTHDAIVRIAVLLFAGYVDAATSMSESCGGGNHPGIGWRREKDDDDDYWARRCVANANRMCRPRGRGRGI